LLIRHSKYSAILSKYTLTDYFFGDFAHWVVVDQTTQRIQAWS